MSHPINVFSADQKKKQIKYLLDTQIDASITAIEAQEFTADSGAIELNSDAQWLAIKQAVTAISDMVNN
jgi:hypothetical protein